MSIIEIIWDKYDSEVAKPLNCDAGYKCSQNVWGNEDNWDRQE